MIKFWIVFSSRVATLLTCFLMLSFLLLQSCSSDTNVANKSDKTPPNFVSYTLPSAVVSGNVDVSWVVEDENLAHIDIQLSDDDGKTYKTIETIPNNQNSGHYTWDSTFNTDGSKYKMKLVASDIPNNVSSVQSDTFAISNNPGATTFSIQLVSPIIDSKNKSPVNIAWTGKGLSGASLDIELLDASNANQVVQSIVTGLSLSNDTGGGYSWDDNSINGNNFIIRLVAHKTGLSDATSQNNGVFTVDNTAPSIPAMHEFTFTRDAGGSLIMAWPAASDNLDNSLLYTPVMMDSLTAQATDFGQATASNSYDLGTDNSNIDKLWDIRVTDAAGNSTLFGVSHVLGIANPNFGQMGEVLVNGGNYVRESVVDPQGRLIAVGNSKDNTNSYPNLALWRYSETGQVDNTFGDKDITGNYTGTIQYQNSVDPVSGIFVNAVAIDTNYKIAPSEYRVLVCGHMYTTNTGTNDDHKIFIYAFNSDGSLDTSFNNGTGLVTYWPGPSSSGNATQNICYGLAVDSSSNIYATGSEYLDATSRSLILLKYNSVGAFDSAFGNAGVLHLAMSTQIYSEQAYDLTLDKNENIYVTGTSRYYAPLDSTEEMVVEKLDTNGNPVNFSGLNSNILHGDANSEINPGYAISTYGMRVMVDSNNNLYVAGMSEDFNPDFALATLPYVTVWRFLESGLPDKGFNGSGKVMIQPSQVYFWNQVYRPWEEFDATLVSDNNLMLVVNYEGVPTGTQTSTPYTMNILKFTPSGLDGAYANNGDFAYDLRQNTAAESIAYNPVNQKIYVSGIVSLATNANLIFSLY